MSFDLPAAINVAPPLIANKVQIVRMVFGIDVATGTLGSLELDYVYGNMSTDDVPVFQQVGDMQQLTLNETQCQAILAQNTTLYPAAETLAYAAISQQTGLNGTVN